MASFAEDRAVERACDLLDFDGDATIGSHGERDWRDRRVNRGPLAGPVVPNCLDARHAPAFPGVGPVDIDRHVPQDGIDISGVERVIDVSQYALSFHHTNITQPVGCETLESHCERAVRSAFLRTPFSPGEAESDLRDQRRAILAV